MTRGLAASNEASSENIVPISSWGVTLDSIERIVIDGTDDIKPIVEPKNYLLLYLFIPYGCILLFQWLTQVHHPRFSNKSIDNPRTHSKKCS